MKLYIFTLGAIFFTTSLLSQTSFEGTIYFTSNFVAQDSTEIENIDHKMRFQKMVGDSVQMLYSNRGDLKFIYPNSSEEGMESYLISSDGSRKRKMKSGKVDNPKGKIRFIGKFKVPNQIVLGLDCECYQYRFETVQRKQKSETYCFSSALPKVDYRLFHLDQNHFERDFFETAERPYLKHIIQSHNYYLEYEAYKMSLIKFPEKTFE